ncbi:methyl-accepting chemotaxis protein [Paucibacter sp. KBW04]|uniref:methyl-accepting chemotaxis protein n=1 Tax=Paucibacter sp. KBW04 TaxID=2153361 RepID=UPI000F568561|nr:methyl-accepting chemotaxis protein [Paucibacter sp. KBW04]RQO57324.1 methyl-accepting chemotaxis protein [Paucibacter sp. KBW04]
MGHTSTFGIAKRLYAASLLLVVCLVVVAVVSWNSLSAVAANGDSVNELRVPQLMRIASAQLNLTRVSLQVRHAILVRTPQDLEATLQYIDHKHQEIDETLAAFNKAANEPEAKEAGRKLEEIFKEFWRVGNENIALIKADKKIEAFDYLVNTTIPVRNRALDIMEAEVKRENAMLSHEIGVVTGDAKSVRSLVVGLVLVLALGLLTFSWYIARLLQRRVGQSQAVVERVRDGNLSVDIVDRENDEFSPLLAAMQEMQKSLTRVVGTVRSNAESVATASAQIAQGNQDLSQRTESQAGALEQTASSMSQLGTTVTQNAESAAQANQLAMSASTVAQQGGDVVGEVVGTMKDINDSSKKIADIISVIDGIAFQTNILALNAAVEAARAGEQGRGFAVVAGEVRSLAQRSAEAAREIKTLIMASVERVDRGTQLVDKAGSTMLEVVSAIRRVSDIVSEIASASAEQSRGVAVVGSALTQMDQSTQQNAALVEQSAAAAESLRGQASQLVEAVAVFRL